MGESSFNPEMHSAPTERLDGSSAVTEVDLPDKITPEMKRIIDQATGVEKHD